MADQLIAFHEAGHAAAALGMGLRVESCRLVPHGGGSDSSTVTTGSQDPFAHAVALLGGPVAQDLFVESQPEEDRLTLDLAGAAGHAHDLGLYQRYVEKEELAATWADRPYAEATRLVRESWSLVELLAQALLARRALLEGDIVRLADSLRTDTAP